MHPASSSTSAAAAVGAAKPLPAGAASQQPYAPAPALGSEAATISGHYAKPRATRGRDFRVASERGRKTTLMGISL